MNFLARDGVPDATRDWEKATQIYLALVAVAQGQRELSALDGTAAPNPEVFARLQELRDLLRFPAQEGKLRFSSPGDFNTTRIDDLSNGWQRLRQIVEGQ
jgi:hypothetical protein